MIEMLPSALIMAALAWAVRPTHRIPDEQVRRHGRWT